jgi:internalin A
LETLIATNNRVSDLTPIGRLPNLIALDMSHNPIADLSPLSTLRRIDMIRITDGQIEDCSPLMHLPTLFVADLQRNPGLSEEEDRELQEYISRARE